MPEIRVTRSLSPLRSHWSTNRQSAKKPMSAAPLPTHPVSSCTKNAHFMTLNSSRHFRHIQMPFLSSAPMPAIFFPLPVVADYEVSVHHVRGIVSAASAVYLVHVRHDARIGPCPALYGIEVSFPVLVMRDTHSRQFRLEKAYHGLLPA